MPAVYDSGCGHYIITCDVADGEEEEVRRERRGEEERGERRGEEERGERRREGRGGGRGEGERRGEEGGEGGRGGREEREEMMGDNIGHWSPKQSSLSLFT